MEHIGIVTLLALALTTYRLVRLVAADKFPFEPLRDKTVGSSFGYLLTCPFCLSVWLGCAIAAGQALVGDTGVWQIFIGGMALSGVVSLVATLAPQTFD